jgi:hypothetical protein
MTTYYYLSLIPEALILSQLPPEKFGSYLAIGSERQIEGPAIFFEVDADADFSAFPIEAARKRCVEHANGEPRKSVYAAVFNVLPNIALEALKRVFLTTPSGISLGLDAAPWNDDRNPQDFYLYQELGPVYPRVASSLPPEAFCHFVTSKDQMVTLPRLAFIDLKLGNLAQASGLEATPEQIPYAHLAHIKTCLRGLRDQSGRKTKIVNRGLRPDILYYLIRNGLFIGDAAAGIRYFPLLAADELDQKHHLWWHSAQSVRGY